MARKRSPYDSLQKSLTLILCGCFISGCLVPGFRPASDSILSSPDDSDDFFSPSLNPRIDSSVFGRYFTENRGQIDSDEVLYYLNGCLAFTKDSVLFNMREPEPGTSTDRLDRILAHDDELTRGHVIQLRFERANDVMPTGVNELSHRSHYFLGDDPSKWRIDVPSYKAIIYNNIYNDIDLIFRIANGRLKYDFVVSPNADPNQIILSYKGIENLSLESDETLSINTLFGSIRETGLYIYQDTDGARTEIEGRFKILDGKTFGYEITGRYDPTRTLVIDPSLEWSTFIGSTGNEWGLGMAVDAKGDAYVTGYSYSPGFPTTPGAYDTTFGGSRDVIVSKLSADGTTLLYSTFIGGSSSDWGLGIEVDSSGCAYITGDSYSSNYPTTPGAFDTSQNGDRDAIITKLNSDGSALVYSTFVGGSSGDAGASIALDNNDFAYISGLTMSSNLSVTINAYDITHNGDWDAFIVKLNQDGTDVIYSSYLGGSSSEFGYHIAVDINDNAYVTGDTASGNFPLTPGAYDTTSSNWEEYITKFSKDGSLLEYSTFLGGDAWDGECITAVDADGNAYLTGFTESSNFPVTPGAYDTSHNGDRDAFFAKLSNDGTDLLYSTFFGGSLKEAGEDIVLDSWNNIYITGYTESSNFPTTTDAYDSTHNGLKDMFLTRFFGSGFEFNYSTFVGGSSEERIFGIAIEPFWDVYIGGYTASSDYPTTPGAYNVLYNGGDEVFVTKFEFDGPPMIEVWEPGGTPGQVYTQGIPITVLWNATDDYPLPANPINITYGIAGSSWNTISTNEPNDGIYDWDTTSVPCPGRYWMNLTVYDSLGQQSYDWSNFSFVIFCPIDSPPVITAYEPGGTAGQAFVRGVDITVTWSAIDDNPLPFSPINISYGNVSIGWIPIANYEVNDGAYLWNTSLVSCPGIYWMNMSVYDSAGQSAYDIGNYSFEISCIDNPPIIEVWEPGGAPGQFYAKGDIINVTWNATDDNPLPAGPITITYGNLTIGWTIVSANEPNDGTYIWDTAAVPCPGIYWMNLSVYDSKLQFDYGEGNFSFFISCPPTIGAWEPGGSPGQKYTKGVVITVIWSASDDEPLPADSISINYMDVYGYLTELAPGEPNDGYYYWDTSDISCPATYWMFLTVTDSRNFTAYDIGNYSYSILCPPLPPEIEDVRADPSSQTVGKEVIISALVTDPDTDAEDLIVNVEITDPNGTILGNFSMAYNAISGRFEYSSIFEIEDRHTFVIWATDGDDNWDSEAGSFIMEAKLQAFNWKPVIALIFALILLFLGILASYHRPLRFKKEAADTFECPSCRTLIMRSSVNHEWPSTRCPKCNSVFDHRRIFAELDKVTKEPVRDLSRDRWYTFGIMVLPFVIAEAITGIVSLLTGLLAVPPFLGLGMIIDLIILICGIVCIVVILKKGESPEPKEEPKEPEKAEGMLMPPIVEKIELQEQYPEFYEDETKVEDEVSDIESEPEARKLHEDVAKMEDVKLDEKEPEPEIPIPIEEISIPEDAKPEEAEPALEEQSPHEEEAEVIEMEKEVVESDVPVPYTATTEIEEEKSDEPEPTLDEQVIPEEKPEVKEMEPEAPEPEVEETEVAEPAAEAQLPVEEKPEEEEIESEVAQPVPEEPQPHEEELEEETMETKVAEPILEEQLPQEEESEVKDMPTEIVEPVPVVQTRKEEKLKSKNSGVERIMPPLWHEMPQIKRTRIEKETEREAESETQEPEPSLADQYPHKDETEETEPSLAKQFPHKDDTEEAEPPLAKQFPHEEETPKEDAEDSSTQKRKKKKEDEENDLVDELHKLLGDDS